MTALSQGKNFTKRFLFVGAVGLWIAAMYFALPFMPFARATRTNMPDCGADTVVWANTGAGAGVYHEQGDKHFARTAEGRYMCRRAAEAAGITPLVAR